jgi:predicted TPR repeat methyltransferase
MDIRQAYDIWSQQYDTNLNKTRDLEAQALRTTLEDIDFDSCLEIGCGTGKNTEWFITKAEQITAIDLSNEMLAKAKEKISSEKVDFQQADITQSWDFANKKYDLISFSLVLEHIENLDHIFDEAAKNIVTGGHVYIGELHPFKQYSGSKARFETPAGQQTVICFNHHISDFSQSAKKYGFAIEEINEYFDGDDRNTVPRILTMLLKKLS